METENVPVSRTQLTPSVDVSCEERFEEFIVTEVKVVM